jgi:hypothetical protein
MKISPVNFANFNQRNVNFKATYTTNHTKDDLTPESNIPPSISELITNAKKIGIPIEVESYFGGLHCKLDFPDGSEEAVCDLLDNGGVMYEKGNPIHLATVPDRKRLTLPGFMTKN